MFSPISFPKAGCILYCVLILHTPFQCESDPPSPHDLAQLKSRILRGELLCDPGSGPGARTPHEAWAGFSTHVRDLLVGIMHPDPAQRLTTQQVLAHPWLTGAAPGRDLGEGYKRAVCANGGGEGNFFGGETFAPSTIVICNLKWAVWARFPCFVFVLWLTLWVGFVAVSC